MNEMSTGIIVAVIAGGFSVIVAFIQSAKKQNHDDHAKVERILGRIEGKIDGHIGDHDRHV